MRTEFLPLSANDAEIEAYREALLKAGVGIETTWKALENACRHVTHENACITSDVVAAYPQVVNMIVHGGFEDERGRVLLVLPRDRDVFRFVRDALADSHTAIAGFARRYVESGLIAAIEKTAERNGMPLGPRSTLTLPGWYTIFPSSGDNAKGRRREARPEFARDGAVADTLGGKGGHISGEVSKAHSHATIDIPDPASMGLPGPCHLDAYLTSKTSVAEIRHGLARVSADRCYLDPVPHAHKWKSFWAYVPDYSERRYCALLTGERCVVATKFKPEKRGKPENGGACPETRNVRASSVSRAVLLPQPPADWKIYSGLEPQKGHVHLWHKEHVRWGGSGVFPVENYYCPLCDAESWPIAVHPDPVAYMNYGPAVDELVKTIRFPKEVRSAFAEDSDQRGSYGAPGAWDKPVGIQKQFKTAESKAEKKFGKEILDFKKEVAGLGEKQRRKAPLSVFLEISERVARKHKRRWKPPTWVVGVDLEIADEPDEDQEDES